MAELMPLRPDTQPCGNADTLDTSACELEMLITAFSCLGHDFRQHARAPLQRRLLACRRRRGFDHVSEMLPGILHDEDFRRDLLEEMFLSVTHLFRDPEVFLSLRETVVPALRTHPYLHVWVAGCATGEEAYSVAILLQEEGLYERSHIYATDINESNLEKARLGLYPLEKAQQFEASLARSGSTQPLYKHMEYLPDQLRVRDSLRKRITFASHNLVSDGVFRQMQLVLCRNVLIYFDQALQNRVLGLLDNSLVPFGALCLGNRESLETSDLHARFEVLADKDRIYRKKSL